LVALKPSLIEFPLIKYKKYMLKETQMVHIKHKGKPAELHMLIKGVTDWLRPAESTKQRFDYLKLWAV
jgi:hypothetical protein